MSHSLSLSQCEALLEPDKNYPLYITAKKYWLPEFESHWDNDEAITLIVLHSTSFHKETWEPALQRIFHRVSRNTLKIKCAWAIDCPNHGVSAALNEEAFQQVPFHQTCESTTSYVHTTKNIHIDFGAVGCHKYPEAVHRFLSAGPRLTCIFDFRSQRLVGAMLASYFSMELVWWRVMGHTSCLFLLCYRLSTPQIRRQPTPFQQG